MGLPKHLEKMLATTLEDNCVKSWSIYEEKDKSFTFKIRFEPSDISSDVDISSTYVRKNEKRQKRDRERAEARIDRCTTRSQTAKAKASTREVSSNSLETFRNEDLSSTPVDAVSDPSTSHCSFELPKPVSLSPVKEIQHEENFDLGTIQNNIDSTLSDSELSLNSTTSAATISCHIPDADDLFLKKDYPEVVKSVPEPKLHVLAPDDPDLMKLRSDIQAKILAPDQDFMELRNDFLENYENLWLQFNPEYRLSRPKKP